jgi:hypothetical protein
MKLVGILSTAVLSLALGAAVPAFTQDREQEDKAKPAQDERKAEPAKPAARQEGKPAAQQEKNAKPEERNAQQEKNAKPVEKNAPQQHAAGNGGRIPADRYKANFGRQHTFRVTQANYSSGRFQYGGYWFGFGGAWPSNWLYTQDVYVIEIDGMYYLCNPMYPGVNLVINVTL